MLLLPSVATASWWDCGLAAVQCVLRFHGVTPESAREATVGHGDGEMGTPPSELASIFHAAGFGVQHGEGMDLDLLDYHVERLRPVICSVTFPESGGHYVVFAGRDAAKKTVSFMDPSLGPRTMPEHQWLECWRDVTGEDFQLVRYGVVAIPPERE